MSLDHGQVRPLFEKAPAHGECIEVAPGILWTRFPLPFRLNHVNVYLIEDGDGYAIFDTGMGTEVTQRQWETMAGDVLAGQRVTRVFASHFHMDHIGCAGWLCNRFNAPLWTGKVTYLYNSFFFDRPAVLDQDEFRAYFRKQGMTADQTHAITTEGHDFGKLIGRLPNSYRRIVPGETLVIGERRFEVLAGEGHAPEQLMLYARDDKLLLVGDQVLTRISPNVAVSAMGPDDDPLGLFMDSLRDLKTRVDHDVMVLPGHHLPFTGLHQRCDELIAHHEDRCHEVLEACARSDASLTDLVDILFAHVTDTQQFNFAFGETHAHVNYLLRRTALREVPDSYGVRRFRTA